MMNRRDALKSFVAIAGVGGITVTAPPVVVANAAVASSGADIVLHANAVHRDLRVYDLGEGEGQYFILTLMQKPWPTVGDRVRFDYRQLHLVGVVEQTEAEPLDGPAADRFFYRMTGRVLAFEALDVHTGWRS